jgi:DNA-binding MarR family transcriptional regulator
MIDTYFCNCLYFTANRLARLMNKMAEEEFAPIGLSPTYAFLIMVVTEYPGINQKDLSEKLHIAPSTCTRFVDKLISKDIVEKKQEGKQVLVFPTEKSNEMLPEIRKCWKKLKVRYSAILGDDVGHDITEQIHLVSEQLG